MKKDELRKIAVDTYREVMERNQPVIHQRVEEILKAKSDSNGMVPGDQIAPALAALAMTFCPEISAIIAANLLVKLGIVTLEDSE